VILSFSVCHIFIG